MSRSLAACVVLTALCACATPSTTQPTAQRDAPAPTAKVASAKPAIKPKVICENEAPLGSHLTTRRCRNAEQADQERQRLQDELLRARSTPGVPGGN
jgi:hypothetical protein